MSGNIIKIGIVIPLKSKTVSKNWNLTCENLKLTVNSVLNQSNRQFQAVIVGHERPKFLNDNQYHSPNLHFEHLEELEPPRLTKDQNCNQLLYEKDRCAKILKGINHLKSRESDILYWFPLDADDLIHKDFVDYICKENSEIQHDALIFNNGYVFFKSSKIIIKENNFSLYCGSSALISDNLLDINDSNSNEQRPNFIFSRIPHTQMLDYLKNEGALVHIPKRRLLIYSKDHGENISDETRPIEISYAIKRALRIWMKKIVSPRRILENFNL